MVETTLRFAHGRTGPDPAAPVRMSVRLVPLRDDTVGGLRAPRRLTLAADPHDPKGD